MKGMVSNLFRLILLLYVFMFAYEWWRPLPRELLVESTPRFVEDKSVHFFADYTYLNENGERKVEQHIWNEAFNIISGAKKYVLLDMFLYNAFQGSSLEHTRTLSQELTDTLILAKTANPDLSVNVVTDPINTVYGGVVSPEFSRLEASGISITYTKLALLRDSNLAWSAFWRPLFSWAGNNTGGGLFPHPFQDGGSPVTIRSWANLLNFKANHRKLIVADRRNGKGGEKIVTLITSANPHDASSAHGNVALVIDDDVWKDVVSGEQAIALLSGAMIASPNMEIAPPSSGALRATILRDEMIKKKVIALLEKGEMGDEVDIAQFYLSDRDIIRAIVEAGDRGVIFRIVLDPNKDAFGFEKSGIPNQPVAKELKSKMGSTADIRWCDTHGEQCHAKLFLGKYASSSFLMLGSANFTRRNVGGYNLEEDILVESGEPFTAWRDARTYFDRIWKNKGGLSFTVDYGVYQDTTIWKSPLYRLMERTGMSSF